MEVLCHLDRCVDMIGDDIDEGCGQAACDEFSTLLQCLRVLGRRCHSKFQRKDIPGRRHQYRFEVLPPLQAC